MRKVSNTILNQAHMPISIIEEKRTIVNNILKAIVILGFAMVVITLFRDLAAHVNWVNMAINTFALSIMVFLLALGKKVSYETKTWSIVIIFIFIGTKLLSVTGL